MKFVDWYFKEMEQGRRTHMGSADNGWQACKREILSLLEKLEPNAAAQQAVDVIKDQT